MNVQKMHSVLQKHIDAGRGDYTVTIDVGCDCNIFAQGLFEVRSGDIRIRKKSSFAPATPPGVIVVGDALEISR
jgi:hypothetical protein